jgi:hypothetical protein
MNEVDSETVYQLAIERFNDCEDCHEIHKIVNEVFESLDNCTGVFKSLGTNVQTSLTSPKNYVGRVFKIPSSKSKKYYS